MIAFSRVQLPYDAAAETPIAAGHVVSTRIMTLVLFRLLDGIDARS
jgi:hypothetical protein